MTGARPHEHASEIDARRLDEHERARTPRPRERPDVGHVHRPAAELDRDRSTRGPALGGREGHREHARGPGDELAPARAAKAREDASREREGGALQRHHELLRRARSPVVQEEPLPGRAPDEGRALVGPGGLGELEHRQPRGVRPPVLEGLPARPRAAPARAGARVLDAPPTLVVALAGVTPRSRQWPSAPGQQHDPHEAQKPAPEKHTLRHHVPSNPRPREPAPTGSQAACSTSTSTGLRR